MGRPLLGRIKVSFTLDSALEDAVDAFMRDHRYDSMSATLNELIRRGLRPIPAETDVQADAMIEKIMTPALRKALARQIHRRDEAETRSFRAGRKPRD